MTLLVFKNLVIIHGIDYYMFIYLSLPSSGLSIYSALIYNKVAAYSKLARCLLDGLISV